MKKIQNFVERHGLMISLLFVVISVLTGGSGICLAEGAPVVDPEPPADPVNPETNDLQDPTGKGAGQDLTGTQGSATQLERGGLTDTEYDPDVVKYNAPKYVLLNLARTVAVQRSVKGSEIDHFRIGEANLMLKTTDDIAEADVITLTEENVAGNLNLLGVSSTIIVRGVKGYVQGSQTETEGELELYVTEVGDDYVKCRPVNGKAKVEGNISNYLKDYRVPAIPENTEMFIASYAGSESQKVVNPDNSQPRSVPVFLQKQMFNIVITDHMKDVLLKTPWGFEEMRDQALANFSKKAEYTLWLGQQRRFIMKIDGHEEYVYTTKGILRQLTNTLGIEGKFKYEHITAIGKVVFTKFAETTEAYMLCGKNKVAEISNMEEIIKHMGADYSHHKTDYGVVVRDLVSNFGTLHIVYAPAMDDLGYEDFAVVAPIQIARYYHKVKKEDNIDLNDAGMEAREAMLYTYVEYMALALRGQNSMLIGPSDKIAEMNISDNTSPIIIVDALPENPEDGMVISFDGILSEDGPVTKVSALPANPTDGMIITPTETFTVGTDPDTVTYEKGKSYIFDNNAWSEYTGVVLDGDESAWEWDATNQQWKKYTGTV